MMPLDANRIAAVALELTDLNGEAGFSIRAVARALDVTPMALYHHVKDKAELAALVLDASYMKYPIDPETGDWRRDLLTISEWTRAHALAHPALPELRRVYDIWTPTQDVITERWIRHWRDSGIAPDKAFLAANVSSGAIWGFVAQELRQRGLDPSYGKRAATVGSREDYLAALPDPETRFQIGFNAIVDGILATFR